MRRVIPMVVLAATVGGVLPAVAGDEADLKAMDEMWAQAAAKEDIDKILTYYADDAVLMDPGPGMVHRGKDAIRKSFAQMFADLDDIKLTFHEASYAASGDVGWGSGLWTMTAKDAKTGQAVPEMKGRASVVFRKREGRWQAIIDHASMPHGPPPAPAVGAKTK